MIGSLELTPSFSAGVKAYTADTSDDSATISATASDPRASIEILLGTESVLNNGTLVWEPGDNEVSIMVTNGSEVDMYTVTVTYTPDEDTD